MQYRMKFTTMPKWSMDLILEFISINYSTNKRSKLSIPKLDSPEEFGSWVRKNFPTDLTVTEKDMAAVRELKAALFRLTCAKIAVEPLAEEDCNFLNEQAAMPRLLPALKVNGITWKCPSMSEVLAQIAYLGVRLLGELRQGQIRKCAGENCNIFFYDTTGNGHRRWCSMALCGNRTKVGTYNRRKRGEKAED